MRVGVRAAAAVILVVLGLAGLFWIVRGGSSRPAAPQAGVAAPPSATASPAPASIPAGPPLPPLTLEQGRITGSDAAGLLQWELRATALDTDAARGEVRLQRVEGKFYERGTVVVTFSAPRAVFSTKTQDVTLSGGVRARAVGRMLEAERLQWLAARRLLVAMGNVRLAQERITVRADRLESDIALRKTKLTGNIRVTVRE